MLEVEIAEALQKAIDDADSLIAQAQDHASALLEQLMKEQPFARFNGALIASASRLQNEIGPASLDGWSDQAAELLALMEVAQASPGKHA